MILDRVPTKWLETENKYLDSPINGKVCFIESLGPRALSLFILDSFTWPHSLA